MGVVSAAIPNFADGIISFFVQLSGEPVSFTLNASTTIAAGSIGLDLEPGLVITPKVVKNTAHVAVQETALIIAVDCTDPSYIYYYCQNAGGRVVKLSSDKWVHGIDKMDPSTSELAILPEDHVTASGLSKRAKLPESNYEIIQRGLTGISANTVTVTEAGCQEMTCFVTGKAAVFNKFTQSCYCSTLKSAIIIPGDMLVKREE